MGVVLPQPIQFGKYTLFERIGRGGMADVFKARIQGPAGFERVFVVKRILPHLCDDPQFVKMFIEEAKMSARLSHPNIVQVFELGNVDAEYFMAMEYMRGRDLADTMRTHWSRIGPPRPELVAFVGREMCRALGYAHELTDDAGRAVGMIHRDVSPSNVMLSYDGMVKILDFGIAKALGGEQVEESATQRGTLKGKFAYMAPEQTQGTDVDRRIDVFAAGIVLHEMLTGRRLFKGENDLQTVEKVRQCDVPPPSLQNPLCPPELDSIVLQALARNRDDRFQSAHEMADALDDVVHAVRFQPTHLAHLMRELFPADAGGQPATGTHRVTQSMTASQSRPHSSIMRSPTVPPVSVSRSTVSGLRSGPYPSVESSVPPLPPNKPLWRRGSVLTMGAALVAAAFIGGIYYTRSLVPVASPGAGGEKKVATRKASITVRSYPEGAKVYVVGSSEVLGVTDFKYTFEFKGDEKINLVFRKPEYEEAQREVASYHPSVSASLKKRDANTGGGKGRLVDPIRGGSAAPVEAPPGSGEPSGRSGSRSSGSGSRSERGLRDKERTPGAAPTVSPESVPAKRELDDPKKPAAPAGRNEILDPFK